MSSPAFLWGPSSRCRRRLGYDVLIAPDDLPPSPGALQSRRGHTFQPDVGRDVVWRQQPLPPSPPPNARVSPLSPRPSLYDSDEAQGWKCRSWNLDTLQAFKSLFIRCCRRSWQPVGSPKPSRCVPANASDFLFDGYSLVPLLPRRQQRCPLPHRVRPCAPGSAPVCHSPIQAAK